MLFVASLDLVIKFIAELLMLTRLQYVFLLALVASACGLLFAATANQKNSDETAEKASMKVARIGEISPDWQLKNLKGNDVQLSEFRGQPVILVFWATWCPYCKKLLPGIQRLHQKYADQGLKIIAVNIREDWKPHVYWRNHEYTFDAVLEGDEVAKLYGISGTPGLVFLDPQGKYLTRQSFSDPEHPLLEKFAQHFLVADKN